MLAVDVMRSLTILEQTMAESFEAGHRVAERPMSTKPADHGQNSEDPCGKLKAQYSQCVVAIVFIVVAPGSVRWDSKLNIIPRKCTTFQGS